MNQMFGMNVEQIHALARDLDAAHAEVLGVLSSLTAGLQHTPWVGNDRNRFESTWQSTHVTQLRNVATALQAAAGAARQHADNQQSASGR